MEKYTIRIEQLFFVLKADNGEAILSGEMYTTKSACNNSIDAVETNAPSDAGYEKLNAPGASVTEE